MNHPIEPRSEGHFGRVAFPFLALALALGAVIAAARQPRELAAGTPTPSRLGPDYDQDGLADTQEWVLGTFPDQADSDGDAYNDLEEVARASDPLDFDSIPDAQSLSVALYTYQENGRLNLHTAIYVDDGKATNLSFDFGVVLKGTPISIASSTYSAGTKYFLFGAPNDPKDKILVIEMPIPDSIVYQMGQVSIYSMVERNGVVPDAAVDIANLVVEEESGGLARIEPSPVGVQGGMGIVYRPLTGNVPTSSTPGQICWQQTSAIGTRGSSIVYEIEQASCESFDSFCSSGDCAGTVGETLELPDPGALVGG